MTRHLLRRVAFVLIAFYAFGQATVALAACGMERGAMAQAMAMPAGDGCDDCAQGGTSSVTASCVAHCNADLQLTGSAPDAAVPVAAIADALMVVAVPRFRSRPVLAHLPAAPPRRILLHSFQV